MNDTAFVVNIVRPGTRQPLYVSESAAAGCCNKLLNDGGETIILQCACAGEGTSDSRAAVEGRVGVTKRGVAGVGRRCRCDGERGSEWMESMER